MKAQYWNPELPVDSWDLEDDFFTPPNNFLR